MKNSKDRPYRLMAPGPVQLSQAVRTALAEPMIHHRTPEFEHLFARVQLNLKKIFQTQQPVMTLTSTGSGAMEAAVANCFSPGEQVLVIVSGKFGERWAKIAKTYGLNVHEMNVTWGQAVDPQQVQKMLQDNPEIRGVFCQACETSTATLHPVKDLASVVQEKPDCLFLVDAITAVGCTPLPMDLWGLDGVVAGSQKAFMLPTGLSFVALSPKAWKFNAQARCPRFYFDLLAEKQANEKNQTHFSSPVAHLRALDVVLEDWLKQGLEHSVRRCKNLAETLKKACQALDLELYSQSPSPSVTAILLPSSIDGVQLREHIEKNYNITLMGGQEQLKGKILRVGHMGDISNEDLLATIEAIGCSLLDLGWSAITEDKIAKALDESAEYLKVCSNV